MIRIGIIGADAVSRLHTQSFLTNINYEIVGCYSPDNRESMVFAREYRLVSYSSLDALFKYTDAIDIAGDFPDVMALAERSLKGMKHVYIAQPHRLSLENVQYLVKLADESGMTLQMSPGYRYCPAYEYFAELNQKPIMIDIRHRLPDTSENLMMRLNTELVRDLDFVLGIIRANVNKVDVKTWTRSKVYLDLLNCRMECDNGCLINLVMQTIPEGDPKLEITFNFPDIIVRTDVFKSVVEKQYNRFDVTDSIVLDAYSEKMIHKQDLKNFFMTVTDSNGIGRRIDEQLQCIAAADLIVERIKSLQPVAGYY